MKLQAWEFSNLVFEANDVKREFDYAYGRSDFSLDDAIRLQLRLADIQVKLLNHLYAVECERQP